MLFVSKLVLPTRKWGSHIDFQHPVCLAVFRMYVPLNHTNEERLTRTKINGPVECFSYNIREKNRVGRRITMTVLKIE